MKIAEITRYESLEDALMFCIRASDKEVKQVAAHLWPSDRIETSHGRLIDALNPNKRQKLSIDEVIFIMHFCGRYDPLYYIADQCLHERPSVKRIEAEQKEIAEKLEQTMNETMKAYQHIMQMTKKREEIEKIQQGHISYIESHVRKVGS